MDRPTDARHTFHRKGVPTRLRVQLLDLAGAPRAGADYVLTVESVERRGKTDGAGWIDEWMSPRTRAASLSVAGMNGEPADTYELQLGELRPAAVVEGVQARLRNLGWYRGPLSGELDDATAAALQAFQAAEGLPATGELDDATTSRLQRVHGG